MSILPLSAFKDNYIWVLPDEASGLFDCVDPGEAEPVIQYAQKSTLSLRAILLTHHHHDHIGGINELAQHFPGAKIYGPEDARIQALHFPLKGNQSIRLGSHTFQILDTPGHTSTHISYYESEKRWLFCGDTLFSAGCGRVFDGTMAELHQSLLLYAQLPEKTAIYCAHEYTAANLRFALAVEPDNRAAQEYLQKIQQDHVSCTLPSNMALEKKINPFLRTKHLKIQTYAQMHGVNPTDDLAIFSFLRREKDNF